MNTTTLHSNQINMQPPSYNTVQLPLKWDTPRCCQTPIDGQPVNGCDAQHNHHSTLDCYCCCCHSSNNFPMHPHTATVRPHHSAGVTAAGVTASPIAAACAAATPAAACTAAAATSSAAACTRLCVAAMPRMSCCAPARCCFTGFSTSTSAIQSCSRLVTTAGCCWARSSCQCL